MTEEKKTNDQLDESKQAKKLKTLLKICTAISGTFLGVWAMNDLNADPFYLPMGFFVFIIPTVVILIIREKQRFNELLAMIKEKRYNELLDLLKQDKCLKYLQTCAYVIAAVFFVKWLMNDLSARHVDYYLGFFVFLIIAVAIQIFRKKRAQ